MAKERQMKCVCGGWMKPARLGWFGICIPGRKCTKCGEETISSSQSKFIDRKLRIAYALKKPRKIIRIGNAMGITIPEELKGIGFCIGKRVRASLEGDCSIKVSVE